MIISDRYRFAFIHIPKCGGTSARKVLSNLDDRRSLIDRSFERGPKPSQYVTAQHGLVNYEHMPLRLIRTLLPNHFDAIKQYRSYALIRDPFERFASSVSQYIKVHISNKTVIDQDTIERHLDNIIKRLESGNDSLLPIDLLSFQPQIDFIELDGVKVVKQVYPVEHMESLLTEIWDKHKILLERGLLTRENVSITYRHEALRKMFGGALFKNIFRSYMPLFLRDSVRKILYVPRDRRLGHLFDNSRVRGFVSNFYRSDIDFWRETQHRLVDRQSDFPYFRGSQ